MADKFHIYMYHFCEYIPDPDSSTPTSLISTDMPMGGYRMISCTEAVVINAIEYLQCLLRDHSDIDAMTWAEFNRICLIILASFESPVVEDPELR